MARIILNETSYHGAGCICEIPGEIQAIIDQIPASEQLIGDLAGDLADVDVYNADIPVAEIAQVAAEKFNALVNYMENVEITVTNETAARVLAYAEENFPADEYEAFKATVNAKLAEAEAIGVYTVALPVGAVIDCAVDACDNLVDLFALLADVDYTVNDIVIEETIALNDVYDAIVGLTSIHPLAYAVMFENTFFVDISDVETNFEAAVADGDILTFAAAYLDNAAIVEPSAAGNAYIAEQILNALVVTCDHVYDDACTDTDCNRCGAVRVAPGHTFTNYVSNNDATCTADGTKTAACDVCGNAFDTVADEGSKLSHEFRNGKCIHCGAADPSVTPTPTPTPGGCAHNPGAAATCTKPQICTICKTVLSPALGHRPGASATCTSAQQCIFCGLQFAPATGHKPGAAATCTSAQKCTVCNAVLANALGHKAGAAATCTEAQKCTVCNTELAKALGHSFTEATCQAPKTCKVCKATEGEKLAHTYDNACDVNCNVCGETRTVGDHAYGEWVVVKEATKDEEGKRERVCSACGAAETEAIPAEGGLSVGGIVGITVASVAVVGGGVTAAVLFIPKKKFF